MGGAKTLPSTVAKGTLDRCTIQEIRQKFTQHCVAITPAMQWAHNIITPFDVHEVLRTLGLFQMQSVVPPVLQIAMPPSGASGWLGCSMCEPPWIYIV